MNKEEAIKIVKSHYPANKQMLNEALEFLIPELKEKTDEEIRQQLIAVVHLYYGEGPDAERDECLEWLEKQVEPKDKGEIPDGYHTFNELYYYRMLYNAAFFNLLPKAWVHKSKKHHDGEECFGGGWFIVMANLPTGQISNHYELKDWELFQIPEKEIADEWDGHTPKEAAERLHKYLLEKQNELDKTHYDIAEKEKYDFVSGQYIECRKSFDLFKEDNSYWLEYVGNDNYVGRSDNILNQKFHITPRQLYCLFTQQHCPKENNVNEETNAPTEYGKYIDRCLNEAAKHFFSEEEDKYSVADLFYAGVKCGENVADLYGKTIKEEDEQKPTQRKDFISIPFGAFDSELVEESITIPDGYVATIEGNKIYIKKKDKSATEAVKEEKVDNVNKVEPKFKVDDYVVRKNGKNFNDGRKFAKVIKINKTISQPMYLVDCENWLYEDKIRLWTLSDAKAGDVLVSSIDKPFIYNGCYNKYEVGAYCGLNINNEFTIAYKQYYWTSNDSIRPATKEERETLFNEMNLLGWIWNPETKELNRLNKNEENNN